MELLSSARPVVTAPAPAVVDGIHITFGEQLFTLRLGNGWREAFRALLWDRAPDLRGIVPTAREVSRMTGVPLKVTDAIVGFRRPDQVDPILAGANLELSEHDIDEIEGATR